MGWTGVVRDYQRRGAKLIEQVDIVRGLANLRMRLEGCDLLLGESLELRFAEEHAHGTLLAMQLADQLHEAVDRPAFLG